MKFIPKFQKSGIITKQKPKSNASWKDFIPAAALATTKLINYIPAASESLALGGGSQLALGGGSQLALGAGESMLPATLGEAGLATIEGGAGTLGLGTLGTIAAPLVAAGGIAYLAKPKPVFVKGSGNIFNPKTGSWENGTRDNFYNQRADKYESQPTSTNLNQKRLGETENGTWTNDFKNKHKKWNQETQATAKHQKFLNQQGANYNLKVNNKWDNATRQVDKNYQTEMVKVPIIQDADATRIYTQHKIQPRSMVPIKQTYIPIRSTSNSTGTVLPDLNVTANRIDPHTQKVLNIQRMLQQEGFNIADDGKWGKQTEAAWNAYELKKSNLLKSNMKQNYQSVRDTNIANEGTSVFQKGGKINGKTVPNDNDEYSIPTKKEGGLDMGSNNGKTNIPTKKLVPKTNTTKKTPIYKPTTKKVEENKKGGKMGKKCSCGCAMKISKNAKGGLIESCACGCKTKK